MTETRERRESVGAEVLELTEALARIRWDRALLDHDQAPRSIVRRYRGLSRRAVERHLDRCLSAPGGGGVRT